jgi:hypothetical protein
MFFGPSNPQNGIADSADHGHEGIFSLEATIIAMPLAEWTRTVAPQMAQGILASMTISPDDAQKIRIPGDE